MPKTKLISKIIFISMFLLAPFSYTKEIDNEPDETEHLTVLYNRTLKSLESTRTSDNIIVEPTEVTSAKHTVSDYIINTPGVSQNGQGGLFQSYNIRGFSRARIKTEVDGIPIITDRRAGNAISFIPAELISSVGIQKGPQSTLYGSGAIGGVVSISTQNVEEHSILGLLVQPQDKTQHIYSRLNNDHLNVNLVYRYAENSKSASGDSSKYELNTQYQQAVATLASEFSWQDIDIFASAIISKGDDIGKSSLAFPEQQVSHYPIDDHLLSQITFSSLDRWNFKFYQHNQQWQTDISQFNEHKLARKNITDYQSDTLGAYGSWLVNNSVIGVEWLGRRNIEINEKEFNATNNLLWQKSLVDAKEDTLAIFLLKDWHFNQFTVETGTRYDYVTLSQHQQQKSDSFLSLSISAIYQASSNTKLNFQLANAFRFPTVSELFYSGETPRGNTQGNSDLRPEKSLGVQLSFSHQFEQNLNLTLNGYYYQVNDYIERFKLDNVRYYRNSEQVTIQGFEISSQWQLSTAWHSNLGFQWQQAYDINDNVIDDSIPKALKWSLQWQNAKIKLRQQVSYQFMQTHVGSSELPRESEFVWHTSAEYQADNNLTLTLSIINLTDNLYKASSDEDAAYQPERTLNLNAVWQF